MTAQNRNFYKKIFNGVAFCASLIAVSATNCNAAVVSRSNSARPSAASSRMPTMTARIQSTATTPTTPDTTVTTETVTVAETPEIVADEPIIENKSSQFDEILDDASTPSSDASSTSLAEQIRTQRAALDASDATTTAKTAISGGQNVCDQNLRACMKSKCGNDFSKCAGDTDTLWGTKMDACRRDLPCTGTEYRMFAAEIRADRDMNARIASYNSIVECGNRYNNCIVTECGTKFNKCLGKSAGDAAISKCEKIARECTEMDSGLVSRTMSVFGTLRQDAEVQVKRDEERLYALRDLMRDTCGRLGAMFDERTLDCVYTVNFYAGEENTLFASKKAYAGSAFDCTPNWFGVDVTTYMENAQRLTREQTSATSALMGSGIGMGVGAITSGAIDRAVDRHKAEQAVKQAEKEHNANYGKETTDTDDESVTKSNDKNSRKKTKNKKQKETSESNKPGDTDGETPATDEQQKTDDDAPTGADTDEQETSDDGDSKGTDTDQSETPDEGTDTDEQQKTDDTDQSQTPNDGGAKGTDTDKSEATDDGGSKKKLRNKKNKSAPTNTGTDTGTSDKPNREYQDCQSKLNRDMMLGNTPARVTEIMDELYATEMAEWNREMDTPLTERWEGTCNYTISYVCNVGDTRRNCVPHPCKEMGKPEKDMFMENEAKEQYISEQCNQYK